MTQLCINAWSAAALKSCLARDNMPFFPVLMLQAEATTTVTNSNYGADHIGYDSC